jgi:hypothetical protein
MANIGFARQIIIKDGFLIRFECLRASFPAIPALFENDFPPDIYEYRKK